MHEYISSHGYEPLLKYQLHIFDIKRFIEQYNSEVGNCGPDITKRGLR